MWPKYQSSLAANLRATYESRSLSSSWNAVPRPQINSFTSTKRLYKCSKKENQWYASNSSRKSNSNIRNRDFMTSDHHNNALSSIKSNAPFSRIAQSSPMRLSAAPILASQPKKSESRFFISVYILRKHQYCTTIQRRRLLDLCINWEQQQHKILNQP